MKCGLNDPLLLGKYPLEGPGAPFTPLPRGNGKKLGGKRIGGGYIGIGYIPFGMR